MESSSLPPRSVLSGSHRPPSGLPPQGGEATPKSPRPQSVWIAPTLERDRYIVNKQKPVSRPADTGLDTPRNGPHDVELPLPLVHGLAQVVRTAAERAPDLLSQLTALPDEAGRWQACLLDGLAHRSDDLTQARIAADSLVTALERAVTLLTGVASMTQERQRLIQLLLQVQQDRDGLDQLPLPDDGPARAVDIGRALLQVRYADRPGHRDDAVSAAHSQLRIDTRLSPQDRATLLTPPAVPFAEIATGMRHGLSATELRAMWQARVPINSSTCPDPVLRQLLHQTLPRREPMPQGATNAVEQVVMTTPQGPLALVWRPENPRAWAEAMTDCGIPDRPRGQHPPAPCLCNRQVLTGRLARHLGVTRHIGVVQARAAVLDGVYGTLNDHVAGLQGYLLAQPQRLRLPPDRVAQLKTLPDKGRRVLQDVASRHGLSGLTLTQQGVVAETALSDSRLTCFPMARPLDLDNAALRRQFTAAAWLHLLTGEVDFHLGNIAFAPPADGDPSAGLRLTLFDNDLSFGHLLRHPEDAVNNQRQRTEGPRTRPERGRLLGHRFPQVIPADLADALLNLSHADLQACGAADLLNLQELGALKSRLGHIQVEIGLLKQQQPSGWLAREADWLSDATTRRLGLEQIDQQARDLTATQGRQDQRGAREIESFGLLRFLAVTQAVARLTPRQRNYPVLVDDMAIDRDLQEALSQPLPTRIPLPGMRRPVDGGIVLSPRGPNPRRSTGGLPELPIEWIQWSQAHGLQPGEARGLIRAGFSDHDWHRLPLPDTVSRSVQHARNVQPPPGPVPEGWTALSVQPPGQPVAHHWFMPIDSEHGLRQLHRALFVQELASRLGAADVVPEVHPYFHDDGQTSTYGLLMRAGPDAGAGLGSHPQVPPARHLRECAALEWMAFLCDLEIELQHLARFAGPDMLGLRPRLPLKPASSGLVPIPVPPLSLPERMDAAMAARLHRVDPGTLHPLAQQHLSPQEAQQFSERVKQAREAMENTARLVADEEGWARPDALRDLGQDIVERATRTARSDADRARAMVRSYGLAARIAVEEALSARTVSPPGSPRRSPNSSRPGSPRGSVKLKRQTLQSPRGPGQRDTKTPDLVARQEAAAQRLTLYLQQLDAPIDDTIPATRRLAELDQSNLLLARELHALTAVGGLTPELQDFLAVLADDAVALPRVMELLRHLQAQQMALPEPRPSVRGLMTLVMHGGSSAESVLQSLAAGASVQDVVTAHERHLSDGWALLASQVLEASTGPLSRQRGRPVTRAGLQARQPLPEVALAVRQLVAKAKRQSLQSPRMVRYRTAPAPERQNHERDLNLRASSLFVTRDVTARMLTAAGQYERATATLHACPVLQADRLAAVRTEAMRANRELAAALQQLAMQHSDEESQAQRAFVSDRIRMINEEHEALAQLSAAVTALRRRVPTEHFDVTAGELLLLQTADGPDLGFQAHGLTLGWRCADILRAHHQHWPSWALECGADPDSAEPVYRAASHVVSSYLQGLSD